MVFPFDKDDEGDAALWAQEENLREMGLQPNRFIGWQLSKA
jgi:hypothetical protein